jgi:hypothetical protein
LPQQILRHLDAIGNYAIRTHRENARQTLIFSFGNSLVVAALEFNIYQLLASTPSITTSVPCVGGSSRAADRFAMPSSMA